MRIRGICCCVCGKRDLAAVSPGTKAEGIAPHACAPRAANAHRGLPMQAWCLDDWLRRFGRADAGLVPTEAGA
jgi:hypothetical protein